MNISANIADVGAFVLFVLLVHVLHVVLVQDRVH
jgi:hypothetical protein